MAVMPAVTVSKATLEATQVCVALHMMCYAKLDQWTVVMLSQPRRQHVDAYVMYSYETTGRILLSYRQSQREKPSQHQHPLWDLRAFSACSAHEWCTGIFLKGALRADAKEDQVNISIVYESYKHAVDVDRLCMQLEGIEN